MKRERRYGPRGLTRADLDRARRAAWFDHVAVERVLTDWSLGRPPDSAGRRLTQRERSVALCALIAVGTTRNEAAQHLRMSHALAVALSTPPPPGNPRAAHERRVTAAVAHLRRLDAPRIIEMRRHPVTRDEADRITALVAGTGDVGRAALFDSAIA